MMDESSGGGQDVKVHDNLSNIWGIFGNLLSIDLLQKVPLDQHVIQGVKRYMYHTEFYTLETLVHLNFL